MKPDRFLSTLSMAAKAGKVVSGEFMCEKSIKSGKSYLTIVSEDASDNTSKKFFDMCKFNGVFCIKKKSSDDLGHYIGKEFRKVVCITDAGFAGSIKKLLESEEVK